MTLITPKVVSQLILGDDATLADVILAINGLGIQVVTEKGVEIPKNWKQVKEISVNEQVEQMKQAGSPGRIKLV